MAEMPLREAQENLAAALSQSAETGEVIYLVEHGARVGAIMTAERAAVLDGLLAVREQEAEQRAPPGGGDPQGP